MAEAKRRLLACSALAGIEAASPRRGLGAMLTVRPPPRSWVSLLLQAPRRPDRGAVAGKRAEHRLLGPSPSSGAGSPAPMHAWPRSRLLPSSTPMWCFGAAAALFSRVRIVILSSFIFAAVLKRICEVVELEFTILGYGDVQLS